MEEDNTPEPQKTAEESSRPTDEGRPVGEQERSTPMVTLKATPISQTTPAVQQSEEKVCLEGVNNCVLLLNLGYSMFVFQSEKPQLHSSKQCRHVNLGQCHTIGTTAKQFECVIRGSLLLTSMEPFFIWWSCGFST